MAELWFALVALMLVAYVVLDGFDLGAGVLHLQLGRTEAERGMILKAIGPVWDGNEVWLIAVGGALFAVFPRVLGAGLSGLYLPIFMVLWSLILRGIGIELRSQLDSVLWRRFWDVVFCGSSILLCVLFGAALGNLLRGVPLGADGYFEEPLFSDFSARAPVGILDWYTLSVGVFSVLVLAAHGATYLAWKTELDERARQYGLWLWVVVAAGWPAIIFASTRVNEALPHAFATRPLVWLGLATAAAGLVTALFGLLRRRWLLGFLGSVGFVTGVLGGTAASVFPVFLPALGDQTLSLTVANSAVAKHGLSTALWWWLVGTPLVIGYFVIVFRAHRGKVSG